MSVQTPGFSLSLSLMALLAGVSAASAEVIVTGNSPFATCVADNVAGQPGINYPNAEVEPWVDADPTNSSRLIAGWQQDRWSDGGSRGTVSAYSTSSGLRWASVVVPGITLCSGGIFQRASDPWVTISPNGTAYFMSLAFMNDLPTGSLGRNSMLVNRSTNGGASWSAPVALSDNNDGQTFDDKNSMTADPGDSNFVYATWDRLIDFSVPPISAKAAPARAGARQKGGEGAANARDRLRQIRSAQSDRRPINKATIFTGPTYFTRTTNGGGSWETPKVIFATGKNEQTINNLIEVLPNGTVINFFTHIKSLGGVSLELVRSTNKGATFGPAIRAFNMVVTNTGTLTPDAQAPVRDANILFDTAVDRQNGNLYVVWQDGSSRNLDKVAFSMSTNGGLSWSTPVIIDKTPYSANKLRNQAFVPSVTVAANHRVVATYYNFQNDVSSNAREATDFWSISCNIASGANCRTAAGWSAATRLTSASFDMLNAPVARGHFLGDYMGLVNAGGTAKSVFGKAVGDNLNDMFATTAP